MLSKTGLIGTGRTTNITLDKFVSRCPRGQLQVFLGVKCGGWLCGVVLFFVAGLPWSPDGVDGVSFGGCGWWSMVLAGLSSGACGDQAPLAGLLRMMAGLHCLWCWWWLCGWGWLCPAWLFHLYITLQLSISLQNHFVLLYSDSINLYNTCGSLWSYI